MISLETTKHFWQARLDPRRQAPSIGICSHVRARRRIFDAQPLILNDQLQAGAAIEESSTRRSTSRRSPSTRTATPISQWRWPSSSGSIHAHDSSRSKIGICPCRAALRYPQVSNRSVVQASTSSASARTGSIKAESPVTACLSSDPGYIGNCDPAAR
jgi:hypothetical protein